MNIEYNQYRKRIFDIYRNMVKPIIFKRKIGLKEITFVAILSRTYNDSKFNLVKNSDCCSFEYKIIAFQKGKLPLFFNTKGFRIHFIVKEMMRVHDFERRNLNYLIIKEIAKASYTFNNKKRKNIIHCKTKVKYNKNDHESYILNSYDSFINYRKQLFKKSAEHEMMKSTHPLLTSKTSHCDYMSDIYNPFSKFIGKDYHSRRNFDFKRLLSEFLYLAHLFNMILKERGFCNEQFSEQISDLVNKMFEGENEIDNDFGKEFFQEIDSISKERFYEIESVFENREIVYDMMLQHAIRIPSNISNFIKGYNFKGYVNPDYIYKIFSDDKIKFKNKDGVIIYPRRDILKAYPMIAHKLVLDKNILSKIDKNLPIKNDIIDFMRKEFPWFSRKNLMSLHHFDLMDVFVDIYSRERGDIMLNGLMFFEQFVSRPNFTDKKMLIMRHILYEIRMFGLDTKSDSSYIKNAVAQIEKTSKNGDEYVEKVSNDLCNGNIYSNILERKRIDVYDIYRLFLRKIIHPLIFYVIKDESLIADSFFAEKSYQQLILDVFYNKIFDIYKLVDLNDKAHEVYDILSVAGDNYNSLSKKYKKQYNVSEISIYLKNKKIHNNDIRNKLGLEENIVPEWLSYTYEVHEYHGGFVVPLLTKSDLKKEGSSMKHCVGGYDLSCKCGRTKIFSILDSHKNRISTLSLKINNEGTIDISEHRAFNNNKTSKLSNKISEDFVHDLNNGVIEIEKELLKEEKTLDKEHQTISESAGYDAAQIELIEVALKPWLRFLSKPYRKNTLSKILENKNFKDIVEYECKRQPYAHDLPVIG